MGPLKTHLTLCFLMHAEPRAEALNATFDLFRSSPRARQRRED